MFCYDLKHSARENLLSSDIQAEIEELIASDVFLTLTAGPFVLVFRGRFGHLFDLRKSPWGYWVCQLLCEKR